MIPHSGSVAFADLYSTFRAREGISKNPIGTVGGVRLHFLDNLTGPLTISSVHLGLIVLPTLGGAPDPGVDPDADWMMNAAYFKAFETTGTVPTISREVVIKSMRKLTDPSQSLFLVLSAASSAGTLNYHTSVLHIT